MENTYVKSSIKLVSILFQVVYENAKKNSVRSIRCARRRTIYNPVMKETNNLNLGGYCLWIKMVLQVFWEIF